MQQIEHQDWPIGDAFNNVGRTVAADRYPDVVTVKNCFECASDNVLVLEHKQKTFLMPVRSAELIYQRQGTNRPVLF